MEYNHREIEKRWQQYWKDNAVYKTEINSDKPKYYVLDMFPYPSGAGLHVGHPLGYIASDIYSRYKRLQGFNVLHPMGYDAYGLPAEQYAIQTGQHPEVTTVAIANSSTRLVFAMIGTENLKLAMLNIISGHNGLLYKCLRAIMTQKQIRLKASICL